jgi:hypothetical protein
VHVQSDSFSLLTLLKNRKKHVDHHPERESLVQHLADLQTWLSLELGARRVLEQEHSLLQHELIRYRLNNSSNTSNNNNNNNNNNRTPSSSTTNTAAAQSNNTSNNLLPPSPVGSIRAAAFSLFSGGSGRKSTRSSIDAGTGNSSSNGSNTYNGRTPSIRSVRMTDEIQSMQESSPAPPPPPNTPFHHSILSAPSTPRINSNFSTSVYTPPPPPRTPAQQLQYGGGATVIQDLDHESLSAIQSRLPSLEELEVQRLFYDKLAEENVVMKMEIQDLRYRNKAEKDSVSVFFYWISELSSSCLSFSFVLASLLYWHSQNIDTFLVYRSKDICHYSKVCKRNNPTPWPSHKQK